MATSNTFTIALTLLSLSHSLLGSPLPTPDPMDRNSNLDDFTSRLKIGKVRTKAAKTSRPDKMEAHTSRVGRVSNPARDLGSHTSRPTMRYVQEAEDSVSSYPDQPPAYGNHGYGDGMYNQGPQFNQWNPYGQVHQFDQNVQYSTQYTHPSHFYNPSQLYANTQGPDGRNLTNNVYAAPREDYSFIGHQADDTSETSTGFQSHTTQSPVNVPYDPETWSLNLDNDDQPDDCSESVNYAGPRRFERQESTASQSSYSTARGAAEGPSSAGDTYWKALGKNGADRTYKSTILRTLEDHTPECTDVHIRRRCAKYMTAEIAQKVLSDDIEQVHDAQVALGLVRGHRDTAWDNDLSQYEQNVMLERLVDVTTLERSYIKKHLQLATSAQLSDLKAATTEKEIKALVMQHLGIGKNRFREPW
ncbi:hypothetical protein CBS101457_000248 [Exobasidium rhododendri]|nr:hypothetical protein CBS101457_000248 [Exobasidium rhododendri]